MAEIAFACPQCGHSYRFAADLAGKRGRCKSCQAVFRIPEPSAASTVLTAPGARPAAAPPPADDGRVAFNCPTCRHPYRLDARLAGKQGRCTSCRGIFTIPARSVPTSPAPSPHRRGPGTDHPPSRPVAAPAAGDSGWWELDSSESIPATTGGPVAARPRAAAAARPAVLSPGEWKPVDDDDDGPIVTATPVRPRWVLYAGIAAAIIVGGITFALVSSAFGPASPPVAEQPKAQPPPTAVAEADDDEDEAEAEAEADTKPAGAPPGPPLDGAAGQHREAVAALTRAYEKIADGYARIRDSGSIADGNGPVAQAISELQAASRRGKALPPLAPPDRQALIRQAGPPLIQAVDRVLAELRRLQNTPGLRSDFDRLIVAYTRTRDEIRREVGQP